MSTLFPPQSSLQRGMPHAGAMIAGAMALWSLLVAAPLHAATVTVTTATSQINENIKDQGSFTLHRTGDTSTPLTVFYTVNDTTTVTAGQQGFFSGPYSLPGSTVAEGDPIAYSVAQSNDVVAQDASSPPAGGTAINMPQFATADAGIVLTIDKSLGSAIQTGDRIATVLAEGLAASDLDYIALPGSATFPIGESDITVPVIPVEDDDPDEGDETITLTLTAKSTYTRGTPDNATITILDAGPLVTVAASDAAAAESITTGSQTIPADNGEFTITRTGDASDALDVNIAVSGTATAGSGGDYNALGNSITLNPGEQSTTLTVTPADDNISEGVETVTLSVQSGSGYQSGSSDSATVTITDTFIAPRVELTASQDGDDRRLITPGDGNVTVTANVTDLNPADTHSYDWSATDNALVPLTGTDNQSFQFDPSGLTAGFYPARVTVTDTSGKSTDSTLLINVVDELPALNPVTAFLTATDPGAFEPLSTGSGDVNADRATVTLTRIGADDDALEIELSMTGAATVGSDFSLQESGSNPAGTSDDDCELPGCIIIPAGSDSVGFDLVPLTDAAEGQETVMLRAQSKTRLFMMGAANTATITLQDDDNQLPLTDLVASQGGAEQRIVTTAGGNISVTAEVINFNGEVHTFDWSATDGTITPLSGTTNSTLTFDPSGLADGEHVLRVTATDSSANFINARLKVIVDTSGDVSDVIRQVENGGAILVVDDMSQLEPDTIDDVDGDGVLNRAEGFDDSDNDGIPDYLDSNKLAANQLQQVPSNLRSRLITTEEDLSLGLGDVAFAAGNDGAEVTLAEIGNYGGPSATPASDTSDSITHQPPYVDFIVRDLLQEGDSAQVVIAQQDPLPANPQYRKFDPVQGWQAFVEDADNSLASCCKELGERANNDNLSSFPGAANHCPAPDSDEYSDGLTEGHLCVRLTTEDGGPNDSDGEANLIVTDAGVVGVGPSVATSQSNDNGDEKNAIGAVSIGAMGSGLLGLALLSAAMLWRRRRY